MSMKAHFQGWGYGGGSHTIVKLGGGNLNPENELCACFRG